MSGGDNIKVAIKVRPLIPREREQKLAVQWKIQGDTIECTNALCTGGKFSFGKFQITNLVMCCIAQIAYVACVLFYLR